MRVFRISKCSFITELSGAGAFLYGGRWNSKGKHILYTSNTSSLAMLEAAAHRIKPNINYCLAEIDIPEDKIITIDKSALPEDWFVYPSPDKLKYIGDRFISEAIYLALKVPSAVNQKEFNFLINPQHPDFIKVKIISTEQLTMDQRLLQK